MNYDERDEWKSSARHLSISSHLLGLGCLKARMPALITRELFILIQLKHLHAIIHGDVTVSVLFAARYR